MRTTVTIDDQLLSKAKRLAAESGRTLGEVVEDALRIVLSMRPSGRPRQPVELPTFKGTGLRPGVDLDNSAALLDHMEDR